MKRLAVVAIVLAAAACAGDQTEGTDTAAPAAGAVEAPVAAPVLDSAARADSIAKADSAAKAAAKTP
jgi:hypothetical protein